MHMKFLCHIQKHKPLTAIEKISYNRLIKVYSVAGVNLAIASDWIIATFLSRLLETKPTPFCKVLLVVFLCSVELLGRQNLANNLPVQFFLMFFQRFPCHLLLLGSIEVYS